ncbi:MAG: hypothetical protein ACFFC3_04280 [Candidatus Odinarchaeota archaeon]
MSLDKWLKSENEKKKQKKKNEIIDQKPENQIEHEYKKSIDKPLIQLTKFILICPNSKCKYQKIIMKKELSDTDFICPRCNKKMKPKVK